MPGRSGAAEQIGDDILERDLLDGDILDRPGGEDLLEDGDDGAGGDVDAQRAVLIGLEGAGRRAPRLGPACLRGAEADDALAALGGVESVDGAVVDLAALVDDDHAFAELLDVRHVVAGQEDRDLVAPVVIGEEAAHGPLADDIEADGGLVEEEHARAVEEGGDKLHLHALTEGEFAHHRAELVADLEQLDEFIEGGLALRLGQAVDVPQQMEGLDGGEVPPQLILLAEDDPVNRFAVSRLLTKAGYQIAVAENGQEALALYEQKDFDVIIMDIQMPVLDGVEATRLIRSKEKTKGGARTPIIALTSYAMKEDQDAFLAAGMDAHLAKPAGMDELQRVMDEVRSKRRDP